MILSTLHRRICRVLSQRLKSASFGIPARSCERSLPVLRESFAYGMLLVSSSLVLQAQGASSPQAQGVSIPAPNASQTAPIAPTEALRPVLGRINETAAGLSVSRWKAPGSVRSVAQRDLDSIQRDIGSTLPPLMNAASSAPTSVPAAFAVYRNISALYDVMLRVAETATLAGPQSDSENLQSTLTSLEAARRDLGDAILQLAQNREREVLDLRATVAQAEAAAAAKPVAPVKTVVDDGPAAAANPPSAAKKKKKPAPAHVSPPAAGAPASAPQ